MKQTIVGKAAFYFETGMEGIAWIVQPDDVTSLKDIGWIDTGDHLTVTNPRGAVLFDGVIDNDIEAGKTVSEINPSRIQPHALGYWIHWTQAGFTADDWAQFFVEGQNDAVLIKAAPETGIHDD